MLETATHFVADLINNFFIVASNREKFHRKIFVLWDNKNPIFVKTNKIISRNVTLQLSFLSLNRCYCCASHKGGLKTMAESFSRFPPFLLRTRKMNGYEHACGSEFH